MNKQALTDEDKARIVRKAVTTLVKNVIMPHVRGETGIEEIIPPPPPLLVDEETKLSAVRALISAPTPIIKVSQRAKTIAIDFDNTIHKSHKNPRAPFSTPVPGAADALQSFRDAGHKIIIHTVRDDPQRIKSWMRKHEIPFDYINENPHQPKDSSNKLLAHHYIDDRAVPFQGDWQQTSKQILDGIPHWREKEATEKTVRPPPGHSFFTRQELLDAAKKAKKEAAARKLHYRTRFQGLPISVENRRNSYRRGRDSDGNEWATKMKHPYGYIRGTLAPDGDHLDCFVGPDKESDFILVVHTKERGTEDKYDEDKVFLGFSNRAEAMTAFKEHYDDWKKHFHSATSMRIGEFRRKIKTTRENPRKLDKAAFPTVQKLAMEKEEVIGPAIQSLVASAPILSTVGKHFARKGGQAAARGVQAAGQAYTRAGQAVAAKAPSLAAGAQQWAAGAARNPALAAFPAMGGAASVMEPIGGLAKDVGKAKAGKVWTGIKSKFTTPKPQVATTLKTSAIEHWYKAAQASDLVARPVKPPKAIPAPSAQGVPPGVTPGVTPKSAGTETKTAARPPKRRDVEDLAQSRGLHLDDYLDRVEAKDLEEAHDRLAEGVYDIDDLVG